MVQALFIRVHQGDSVGQQASEYFGVTWESPITVTSPGLLSFRILGSIVLSAARWSLLMPLNPSYNFRHEMHLVNSRNMLFFLIKGELIRNLLEDDYADRITPLILLDMLQIMAFVQVEDGPKYMHEGEFTVEGVKVSIYIQWIGDAMTFFEVSLSCNLVWEYSVSGFFAGFCGSFSCKQVVTSLQVRTHSWAGNSSFYNRHLGLRLLRQNGSQEWNSFFWVSCALHFI